MGCVLYFTCLQTVSGSLISLKNLRVFFVGGFGVLVVFLLFFVCFWVCLFFWGFFEGGGEVQFSCA